MKKAFEFTGDEVGTLMYQSLELSGEIPPGRYHAYLTTRLDRTRLVAITLTLEASPEGAIIVGPRHSEPPP